MKSAKVRLVEHLAGHLRVVDFSWWDLDRILKAAVNKALKDSGTQVVEKKMNKPRTMVQVHPGRKREVEILKEALDRVEARRREEGTRQTADDIRMSIEEAIKGDK